MEEVVEQRPQLQGSLRRAVAMTRSQEAGNAPLETAPTLIPPTAANSTIAQTGSRTSQAALPDSTSIPASKSAIGQLIPAASRQT